MVFWCSDERVTGLVMSWIWNSVVTIGWILDDMFVIKDFLIKYPFLWAFIVNHHKSPKKKTPSIQKSLYYVILCPASLLSALVETRQKVIPTITISRSNLFSYAGTLPDNGVPFFVPSFFCTTYRFLAFRTLVWL